MVDVVDNAVTKIYESQSLTVTARIDRSDVGSIEEVAFKFLRDGEQFEEKTVPIAEGGHSGGQTNVSHTVSELLAVNMRRLCWRLSFRSRW